MKLACDGLSCEEAQIVDNWREFLADSQQGAKALVHLPAKSWSLSIVMWFGSGSFLTWASRWDPAPANTLFTLVSHPEAEGPAELCLVSWPTETKIIHVCCLGPIGLWQFVMQQEITNILFNLYFTSSASSASASYPWFGNSYTVSDTHIKSKYTFIL